MAQEEDVDASAVREARGGVVPNGRGMCLLFLGKVDFKSVNILYKINKIHPL